MRVCYKYAMRNGIYYENMYEYEMKYDARVKETENMLKKMQGIM